MLINLVTKVGDGISINKEVAWIKYLTETGGLIAFWGELDSPQRNITALKNQQLPVQIEILDPELCMPTSNEKCKYGLTMSVPSRAGIIISPEF